ncbi:uncharacterized protein LOC130668878 [Microplitis mediator]|uniref:uncharacterized protein LOC130668878 n=1 Tax=Microplitis mediator TaxID=375433 RepID=UPI002552BFD5|nr:uncharacterized protein LOC130668878 [Microplitis mediator]
MKRRRVAFLVPLAVLLIASTICASPTSIKNEKTAEVEQATSTTVKTSGKPEPTVSITEEPATSNQPEVTTGPSTSSSASASASSAHPIKVSHDQHEDTEDSTKEFINFKNNRLQEILKRDKKVPAEDLVKLTKPVINFKDALLQEINTLDASDSNKKIKEKIKLLKDTQKTRPKSRVTGPLSDPPSPVGKPASGTAQSRAMKELLEAESDVTYGDDLDDDEDDDDEDDDDDNDEDDSDDGDDDDYGDDDVEDEEDIMTNCPDYCRCAGQYAAATTARCSKLIENQSFGPGIAHLLIENAGEIRLGPHSLRARDLEHLETITIVDTRVSLIDRTAFDGIPYLFAVNLSRNGIIDIHPDTFQNNTQLNLLTISGNPFWRDWSVTKDYLLNAPSVTEFDFSWNSMPRLPKSAFSKMLNLAYLNLKQNRLSKIEKAIFKPLSSLVELDLSGNLLSDLPNDVFEGTDLQSLKLSDNFLTTLASVKANSLDILDVSNNRIKIIAKSDLDNVPSLEQLIISGNGLKRIHQHAFSELDQLEHLDISNNKLTSFTEHHLRNSPRLEVLLMSDNPDLGALPIFKINGLEYNTYSVYRFECANCGLVDLKNTTFYAMPAIANLNLARNRLTGLPKGLLSPLSSLRELDISDNMIAFIPSDMLHGATSLTKLNLAGNPLMTLQVTPFLQAPELTRLDVSRCMLKRVWSEARQHFKSLRFLSVRGNELERITVEELKATPKLSGLDLSQNPLNCDAEFDGAIQWLTTHGVIPTETVRYISNLGNSGTEHNEPSGESVTRWSDLAKLVCEDELEGPVPQVPQKPQTHSDEPSDEDAAEISKDDLGDIKFVKTFPVHKNNRVEDVWLELDKNVEYDDYTTEQPFGYFDWYRPAAWSILVICLVILGVLLIIIQFARFMANRRGRGHGPVIRPPMILRPGRVDNKNCGLIYKPLQEEIPTPQMSKKPSGYSRGPFHYKQIVPTSA